MKIGRSVAAAAVAVSAVDASKAAPGPGAVTDEDVAWLAAAHRHNLAAIAAGRAAQDQAASGQLRELGVASLEEHARLDADLTTLASVLGVALPTAPSPDAQSQLDHVMSQRGTTFDVAWVTSQTAAQQQTVATTKTEISVGSNETVVQLATATLQVIEHHLDELHATLGRRPET
jgi:putative membrane protein